MYEYFYSLIAAICSQYLCSGRISEINCQCFYNNGIVIAKHIFFYHVYGAENLNSLQIPLDDALYLKHILFQEIHALFHTNHL